MFGSAIQQLGTEKLDARLGGVYALEQIRRDARELHWPIIGPQRAGRPPLASSVVHARLSFQHPKLMA